jgi:uncharacterized protein YeaO (DUF488 family)
VRIKRIYADRSPDDGQRVLVDRLWPRGISRASAALDDWMTEIAPSPRLRTWFGHDPERWAEFRRRYRAELRSHGSLLEMLRQRARHQRLTLLYGARDAQFNHAVVLREMLLAEPSPARRGEPARGGAH